MDSRRLETDAIFSVARVFKGSADAIQTIGVVQFGGTVGGYREETTQYALMQAGERYILFANEDKRPGVAPMKEFTRYEIFRVWVGSFRVDGEGNIHLNSGSPLNLRVKYDGAPLDELAGEIVSVLRR